MTTISKIPAGGLPPVLTERERREQAARKKKQQTKENRAEVNRRRWAALNTFTDQIMREVGAGGVAVWLALFRHADAKGECIASLAMLETRTGLHRKTVQRAMKALIASGAVTVVRAGNWCGATEYLVGPMPEKPTRKTAD